MGHRIVQNPANTVWRLARNQHGVVSRAQLLELGVGPKAIKHRITTGRLHPVWRGVYAVGRPHLTIRGRWMAAILTCGPDAVLSHASAAALWAIRAQRAASKLPVDISVSTEVRRRRKGIRLHRRSLGKRDVTRRDGIPVTSPARTLIDLATLLGREPLEAAVNEADKLGLIDPERLRVVVNDHAGVDGVALLREVLDRRTFQLTDSELERRFLRIVRRAGLPPPTTRRRVNAFRVDFHWPDLGLIVESDGLRYHRTPAQQARDRIRDQKHMAAGLTPLRFTDAQIRFEPGYVAETLAAVVTRLQRAAAA
jgi:very-short-patch-repair endonuclease